MGLSRRRRWGDEGRRWASRAVPMARFDSRQAGETDIACRRRATSPRQLVYIDKATCDRRYTATTMKSVGNAQFEGAARYRNVR